MNLLQTFLQIDAAERAERHRAMLRQRWIDERTAAQHAKDRLDTKAHGQHMAEVRKIMTDLLRCGG